MRARSEQLWQVVQRARKARPGAVHQQHAPRRRRSEKAWRRPRHQPPRHTLRRGPRSHAGGVRVEGRAEVADDQLLVAARDAPRRRPALARRVPVGALGRGVAQPGRALGAQGGEHLVEAVAAHRARVEVGPEQHVLVDQAGLHQLVHGHHRVDEVLGEAERPGRHPHERHAAREALAAHSAPDKLGCRTLRRGRVHRMQVAQLEGLVRPEHAPHSQRRRELLGASLCLATGRGGQDGSVEQAQTVEHEALVPVARPVDQTGHVDLRVGATAVHAALRVLASPRRAGADIVCLLYMYSA